MPLTVAVTGVTGDVGFLCCKMLATCAEVTSIVVTARTLDKCRKVVASLEADTGKSIFTPVVLNLSDRGSIMDAVESFPNVDRLCLNAGGLGTTTIHTPSGVTDSILSNVLGNSIFSDNLVKAGKIQADGRIIYVGSEVSRAVWSFTGLLPNYCWMTESDIEWAISTNYNADCGPLQTCCCLPVRQQLGDYKNAKIIGQLYYAGFAIERPDIYTITISPGGVLGSFADSGLFPLKQLGKYVPSLFQYIRVTQTIETGVQRYIDVIVGERIWEPGSMVLSDRDGCPCLWGARGQVTDNRKFATYLHAPTLDQCAVKLIRARQVQWANCQPPVPSAMTRTH